MNSNTVPFQTPAVSAPGDTASHEIRIAGSGFPSSASHSPNQWSWSTTGQYFCDADNPLFWPARLSVAKKTITKARALMFHTPNRGRFCVYRTNGANKDLVAYGDVMTFTQGQTQIMAEYTGGWTFNGSYTSFANGDMLGIYMENDASVATGLCQSGVGHTLIWAASASHAWQTTPISAFANQVGCCYFQAFTNTTQKRFDATAPGVGTFPINHFSDTPYWIMLEGCTQSADQSMTFDFYGIRNTNTPAATQGLPKIAFSLVLNNVGSQISYGNPAALTSVTDYFGTVGDVWDFALLVMPVTKKVRLFAVNRTHGQAGTGDDGNITLVSLASLSAAAVDTELQMDAVNNDAMPWQYLTVSSSGGTPVVTAISVDRMPFIGGVSSWFNHPTTHARVNLSSALQTCSTFAAQPYVFPIGESAGRFTIDATQIAFYTRYGLSATSTLGRHGTRDVKYATIIIEAGAIINDSIYAGQATNYIPGPTWQSARPAGGFSFATSMQAMVDIVRQAKAQSCEVIICDLPPRTVSATEGFWYHTIMRKKWNRFLQTLCDAEGCTYVQTCPILTDPATVLSNVGNATRTTEEQILAGYNDGTYAHLTTGGWNAVAAKVAQVYENGSSTAVI